MTRFKAWILISAGVGSLTLGVILIVAYVSEALIAPAGEPDQSRIFWYLPILFIGLILAGAGLPALRSGWSRLRM